jgi:hypothetical protein
MEKMWDRDARVGDDDKPTGRNFPSKHNCKTNAKVQLLVT